MGYLIYRLAGERRREQRPGILKNLPVLLVVSVVASMLPDIDAVLGVVMGDFSRFHNGATHSLITGVVVSLFAASILWWRLRAGFARWFALVLLNYEAHVIMDFLTRGRGVMLLWPFSVDRFSSPIILFTGVRWSEGLVSVLHLWTLVNELIFALIVVLLLAFFKRSRMISSQ